MHHYPPLPYCSCAGADFLSVRGADFLSVFDKPQRDALAMLFVRLHHQEPRCWGVSMAFPLAVLVYRSGLLLPQYEDRVPNIAFPSLLREMAFMLWLVIMGVNVRKWEETSPKKSGVGLRFCDLA